MELQNSTPPPSQLAEIMAARYGKPQPCPLLPSADLTTANLLDAAAASATAAIFGPDTEPREGLRRQIKANADLLASGDTAAMAAALARQATALDLATYGLLAALAAAKAPEHRLALARAVSTLHGAALRSLSAIRQISHGSEQAS
jgi:hypothetical protein